LKNRGFIFNYYITYKKNKIHININFIQLIVDVNNYVFCLLWNLYDYTCFLLFEKQKRNTRVYVCITLYTLKAIRIVTVNEWGQMVNCIKLKTGVSEGMGYKSIWRTISKVANSQCKWNSTKRVFNLIISFNFRSNLLAFLRYISRD